MKSFESLLYLLFVGLLWSVSLPVQGVLGAMILVTSGWPMLYRQKRTGLNGKPFWMVKFRTMRVGAEKEKQALQKRNEANGPVFKIHNDPRFTRIGKFLSHTGLDELPQLWNVLRGDMALIGPRPLPVEEAKKLKAWQKKRHDIKPGIISPWIVEGYHHNTFDTWMKSDIAYIQKKSLWYDLGIFSRAIALFATLLCREVGDRLKKISQNAIL